MARDEVVPTALHQLPATPRTVHWGYFDAALAPALRVRSGDLIRAEAITHHAGDAPELMMDEPIQHLFRDIPVRSTSKARGRETCWRYATCR